MTVRNAIRSAGALAAFAVLLTGCAHHYANPIAKQTDQPDKVLFDKAIDDLSHNKFSVARMELTTLINAYPDSEYLAKAKLAIADSWYQEGDQHAMAQAEAEYKDFILFYPAMEESAEAQAKVCDIHYKQMDKADRDPTEARRAEDECRTLLTQYPNSKAAPDVEQKLRNIQENQAEGEFKTGKFYATKGDFFASSNRFQTVADNFPIYSKADEALWQAALGYDHLGDRYEKKQIELLTRLYRDYPLSVHVEEAKAKLQALNAPIPEQDQVALARMQYELENRGSIGALSKFFGAFSQHPNLAMAAKSGAPRMENMHPLVPARVPPAAAGLLGTSGDVTVSVPADPSLLDTKPDARAATPAAPAVEAAPGAGGAPEAPAAPGAVSAAAATGAGTAAATGPASNTSQKTAAAAKKKLPKPNKAKEVKPKAPPKPAKAPKPNAKQPAPAPATPAGASPQPSAPDSSASPKP